MVNDIKGALLTKWKSLPFKTQQKYIVAGLISGTFLFFGAGYSLISSANHGEHKATLSDKEQINLQTPKDIVNPNLSWRQQMEAKQNGLEKKLDEVVTLIKSLSESKKAGSDSEQLLSELKGEIAKIQEQFATAQNPELSNNSLGEANAPNQQMMQPGPPPSAVSQNPPLLQNDYPNIEAQTPQGVVKFVLQRKEGGLKKAKATVDNTIPSGTFARAVIMGGVDASTSVNAQSNPKPVMLRIVDKGTLPRQFKSDLKHCHVIASAYGDISSERVEMRLEKLSCVEELTGEISDIVVSGYVAGEDGKEGVRGVMVDRAGAQLRNAFVSGFFGGMGEFLTQNLRGQSVSMTPIGQVSQFNPLSKGDVLKAGAGKGINSAFEKLSDYYIKRAEQLQPVLQVAAGRVVDIIFTNKASLEDTDVRQTISTIRDVSREQNVKNLESQGDDMTQWIPSSSNNQP